ncbi:ABC transporter ATP-binding protein (plasmid) [Burkholderia humptydooensis]|uniref:ABC transporter ATP-binding protein n=2 Tax=Burkholderia humptydooensis TaxID=430531 RepID=A0A7U4SUD0_9BURK|nr:ABC transporter ATP-binding protein [Burkholderia humptydooensis]ALX44723.1 ABC transporter ATP-binding protein [Burkholderia humptydooensis]QPS42077.1 ABC transporter ATP-binding protein [Burkholderia humptydooensis]
MSYLKIAGLSKAFGKKQVLDGLDLEVRQGECLVVFGGSGSGKTTLLRHIAGVMEADAGSIEIGGRDVAEFGPEQRGVAMAFQNFALYPHMTAYENIASPLRARKMPENEVAAGVQAVASLLRIDHVLMHLPKQLSNGQKQRTSLARSLVHKPPVLLLDDPLRNVDAKMRFEMRLEFPRLFKAFGSTVLYVTQDYREALALGDRIGVLESGRFKQVDSPSAIYRNPGTREVARLFGDPPINLFEVTPRNEAGGLAVSIAGLTLRLPDMRHDLIGRTCVLGVRPEDVIFGTEPTPGAMPVVLEAAMPFNVRTITLLKAGLGGTSVEMLASRPEDTELAANRERIPGYVSIAAGRTMFFDCATGARL